MTLNEVQDQILSVMSKHVPAEHSQGDGWMALALPELGIDSLTMTEIVFDLEEALNVEIDIGKMDAGLPKMKALEARDVLANFILAVQTAKAA